MKLSRYLPVYCLSLLLISACGDDSSDPGDKPLPGDGNMVDVPGGGNMVNVPVAGDAVYTVTFKSDWSESSHPGNFPDGAHFSDLIGATHNINVSYWEEGELASPGIESMAENGGVATLSMEINASIDVGDTDKLISANGLSSSPSTRVITSLPVKTTHTFVSIVTMLAPSPDWFVGVSGVDLMENGVWVENKTVDLFAYDAGTDDGATFNADDSDSNPKQGIQKIMTSLFVNGADVAPVGQMIFEKQ